MTATSSGLPASWRAPQAPEARRALWLLLALWAAVSWWCFGDDPIGASWREADTQAIARNLVADGFDLLHPRIDWRGASDGSVECEFPLYQAAVALLLGWFGDVEWPGRLVSLLSTVALAGALFTLLERRTSGVQAWLGTAVFLGSSQVAFVATRVMPDACSAALALAGLVVFVRWLDDGRTRTLAVATLGTLLGVLAKPTAAQVVLVQVAWAAVLAPHRLREVRPWLAWAVVAAGTAAWMLHARSLGLATGLTFGVTFGDTKMPALDHLLQPSVYRSLVGASLQCGMSWFGLVGALVLAVRRRLDLADLALLAVVVAGLLGSLRYSHAVFMGPQYHLWSALAGAWLFARAWPVGAGRPALWGAAALLLLHGAWFLRAEAGDRRGLATGGHQATTAALRTHTQPDDLLVIRGPKPRFDPFWRRPNNFEEPVLLYLSRRRGWVLPADGVDAATLEQLAAAGARWYVETMPDATPRDARAWLERHAVLVERTAAASIYALGPR